MRLMVLACLLLCIAGCSGNSAYNTEELRSRGLVLILPGVEGIGPFNRNIRQGLVDAHVNRAIEIVRWGSPLPLVGMAFNQSDPIGHHLEAERVAKMIVKYQVQYPDRPVYLIGHSGGCGIAVFAAEALARTPGSKPLEGMVLLAPSVSANYDLSPALAACRQGILNFYNEDDELLHVGTGIMGNMDGGHGASGGRVSFNTEIYPQPQYARLYQIRSLGASGAEGNHPHVAVTEPSFVSMYVAPWISSTSWPLPEFSNSISNR